MKIETASVRSNERIAAGIWRMELHSPAISEAARGPGQFVSITVSDNWELPLRRPMSIAGVENGKLHIIFKVFGRGTRRLSQKEPGDPVSLLGPLGNTFRLPSKPFFPILVGGGVGIAPVDWFHRTLTASGIGHDLIIGAVTADEHFHRHRPEDGIFVTTDDGSAGEKGTVMLVLERETKNRRRPFVYACGPGPMLKAVHEFVSAAGIPCQMAVESYMACGTGICQGCVIPLGRGRGGGESRETIYSLVCREGPVYDAGDITL
ncbi:MAG: dihydroorotate dehydrogenase electron transfer subunit [Fidelibacterota bacterium]